MLGTKDTSRIDKLFKNNKIETHNNLLDDTIKQTNNVSDKHIKDLLEDNNYVFASDLYIELGCVKRKTIVADTYKKLLKLIERHKLKGCIYQKQSLKREKMKMGNVKTFQEVIRDIKKGEEWVHGTIRIAKRSDSIVINTDRFLEIGDNVEFELQRNKVSFTEAFAAYEQGKEIESCWDNEKYKKAVYDENKVVDCFWNEGRYVINEDGFDVDEIREQWYINE